MSGWRGKSLWSVSSRFSSAGLAFLFNVLLTRTVSRNDIGMFFLSISIAWGGSLVCQWGASILAVKWVATARTHGNQEGIEKAVCSLLLFTIFQGFMVSLVFMLAPRPFEMRLIWACWTFALGFQSLLPDVIRGFNDLKWASLLAGPIPQLFNIVVVGTGAFFLGGLTFPQLAALTIFANLACSAVGLILIFSKVRIRKIRLRSYRQFLLEATPIGLSLSATFILSQADLWVCGALLKNEDVAIYGIAQRFTMFVAMPLMIFGSVATPAMTELFATRDWDRLRQMTSRGTFLATLAALFIYMGGLAFGWLAMRYLFGVDYTAAYPLFVILGFGQLLHAAAGPNGYMLLLFGEQQAAMMSTILAAMVLFICAMIGGHVWGTRGIAAASAFALTVQTVWMWYQVRWRLKISSHFKLSAKWR